MSSAIETPSHQRRYVAIGTSIGAASVLLLVTLASIFAIRRWRNKAITQHDHEATDSPTPSQEPKALMVTSAPVFDHNSVAGPIRELRDSAMAKVELLDQPASLGSGNEIPEMSEALPPMSHEWGTSPVPHLQWYGHSMLEQLRDLYVDENLKGKSWTSFASSELLDPAWKTVMTASALRKKVDKDSASMVTF